MHDTPRKGQEKHPLSSASVSTPRTETAALRTHLPLDVKLNLMQKRLQSLGSFERLSLEEFTDSVPGLERLLPLLAQSSVDICYTLLLDRTGAVPRSYYDLIDCCEKKRILPTGLVRRLCRQLVLIDTGFQIERTELAQMHRGMRETGRVFRQFLEHVKGSVEARSAADLPVK
jgi:hypothetical protein